MNEKVLFVIALIGVSLIASGFGWLMYDVIKSIRLETFTNTPIPFPMSLFVLIIGIIICLSTYCQMDKQGILDNPA